jgi:SRSO17 transposase
MTMIEQEWVVQWALLMERVGGHFTRSESRQHVRDYVVGLLSTAERKNGWQLAEITGEATPYGIQQFLYRSPWDTDAVCAEIRTYVVEHLGDRDGVLIVDETGFMKKGIHSAGVRRQYSGTAGGLRTVKLAFFWPMPLGMVMRCSTAHCICLRDRSHLPTPIGRAARSGRRNRV